MNKPRPGLLGDYLVFALPILGLFQVELVGQLYIHELILAGLCFFLIFEKYRYFVELKGFALVGLIMAWLVAQVVTDVIRDTPAADYLRGWAKISFFMISFVSLSCLLVNSKRILLWVTSSIIPLYYRPYVLFIDNPDPLVLWKFGVGPAALLLCCAPFLWRIYKAPDDLHSYKKIIAIHVIFGGVSLFLNSRSFAGLSLLTAVLVYFYMKYRRMHLKAGALVNASVVFLVMVNVLAAIYSFGASSGIFGQDAQEKYESQIGFGATGALSMLLGGRSESLVSTEAIADSPLIGHGSWAKDHRYSMMLAEMRWKMTGENEQAITRDVNDGLIPSHSYLLGAWVEAGIIGGLFWISILGWIILKVFPSAWRRGDVVGLCCIMAMPLFFWNVLFSPFGANVRVDVAASIAIFLFVTSCIRGRSA